MRSDKPRAIPFQMWMEDDLLPTIEEKGYYIFDSKLEELNIKFNSLDTKEREAKLAELLIQNKKSEVEFVNLCTAALTEYGGVDDRDMINAKDLIRNIMVYQQPQRAAITYVEQPSTSRAEMENEEYSISRYIKKFFVITNLTSKEVDNKCIAIGKLASKKYRELHENTPPTRTQWVDGTSRDINHYVLRDYREFLYDVIIEYFNNKGITYNLRE